MIYSHIQLLLHDYRIRNKIHPILYNFNYKTLKMKQLQNKPNQHPLYFLSVHLCSLRR